MAGNSFGQLFRISTFGESHGEAIGVIIDGCPAGLTIDEAFIQSELDRRKPGQSKITSPRKESDTAKILSGIFEGKSTGAPIAIIIPNENIKSADYDHLKNTYRPSHADYTYEKKYGLRDYRGGGRSSARETACRVAAGAIAKLLLYHHHIEIAAFVSSVADIHAEQISTEDIQKLKTVRDTNIVHCPDAAVAVRMIEKIEDIRQQGDTLGGIISCIIKNVPVGLGEPVYDKLQADLGKAMLSINAVHGFDYGSGFAGTTMRGSEHNDIFVSDKDKSDLKTLSNYSGGIQGGITNGEDIYFRVAFKPVATIMQVQKSVDKEGQETALEGRGRHDPCVVPRAVPIVEAMAALVLADHLLRNRSSKI